MARRTIIKHPDGTVTEITTQSGCLNALAAVGWFWLAAFVLVAPAAWWGLWSIPAYVLVIPVLLVGVIGKRKAPR